MTSKRTETQNSDAPRKRQRTETKDAERVAFLLMNEAQMSLQNAGRIVVKLIAVSVIGFTLASNCFFSWHLVPFGVVTLAIAAGWLDAIGKECSYHRFFPQKSLNSMGASIFKWQWVLVGACIVFALSFGLSSESTLSLRLSKVFLMALIPLALMLLARMVEPFNFQHARRDIQQAEALVRQLATTVQAADTKTSAPLIQHEKIPVYRLGSVAKVLYDVAASYDTKAKLKVDLTQSQCSKPNGALQQMSSLIYAPFRRVASELFLWEKRDFALYVVAALYIAMLYSQSLPMTRVLPLLSLLPFMLSRSKVCRYVQTIQESIHSEQRRAATSPPVPKEELPSVGEIRAAVPPECFDRSTVKSLLLVLRDAAIITSFAALATLFLRVPGQGELSVFDWLGWATYAFWQGTAFTGWWVLAHECGHGAFSASTAINDTVGYVLHSILLVPYFSWQYSHAKHHSKTNHLVDGESHVPDTHDDLEDIGFVQLYRLIGRPAYAVVQLIAHLVFGWPAYLLFNITGGRRLAGKPVKKPFNFSTDHFRPNSDLFPPSWRCRIALSTFGIFVVLGVLAWASWTYGFGAVAVYYLMPYMWCNFWLVLYTWMQHTDLTLPHYGDSEWTWVRGALCTIDRPYGIFDFFHHRIGSTHVCHHLFSKVPCYHAKKATEHLKAFLEPRGLYNYDPTWWPIAAWRVAMTCHYVEGVEGVQYYKTLHSKTD
jgi:omega-6 fatty acid desaturase (delta-12 desaturase)